MKGIVFDKNNNNLIVLTKEGQMKKIKSKSKNVNVGEEVDIPIININRKLYSSIAAAIVFCIFSLTLYMIYYTPFGYVFVDINPSIKIVYNRFDKVIDTVPLNEDGENILSKVNLEKQKIDIAVESIVTQAKHQSYLKENKENYVLVTVSEFDKNHNVQKTLTEKIDYIDDEDLAINWAILDTDVSEYKPTENESLGLSVLKEKIKNKDNQNYSVKELLENYVNEEGNNNKLHLKGNKFKEKIKENNAETKHVNEKKRINKNNDKREKKDEDKKDNNIKDKENNTNASNNRRQNIDNDQFKKDNKKENTNNNNKKKDAILPKQSKGNKEQDEEKPNNNNPNSNGKPSGQKGPNKGKGKNNSNQ